MYCRKCGTELKEDSKFCFKCGTEVSIEKVQELERKHPKKKMAAKMMVILLGCMLLLIGIAWARRVMVERQYNDVVENANIFLVNGYYDKAIEKFLEIIEEKPEVADHYIKLATAYVESGDLYRAKNILKMGYSNTQDASLLNVSIWGPLSSYEIVLMTSTEPIISRCEYVFLEDSISGYIYFCGALIGKTKYYFDDFSGRLIGGTVFMHEPWVEIHSNAVQMVVESEGYHYNCLYNDVGELVAVQEIDNNEMIATMEYKDGKCIFVDSIYGEANFQYDENGRIVSYEALPAWVAFALEHPYYRKFNYNEDGSYSLCGVEGTYPFMQGEWKMTFDKKGLIQEIICEEGRYFVAEYKEDGKVELINGEVEDNKYKQQYEYNENGNVSKILIYRYGGETNSEYILEVEIIYKYNSDMQVTDIKYEVADDIDIRTYESESYHFEYNEQGQIVRINGIGTGDANFVREYTYSDDGKLETMNERNDNYEYVYEFEYDEYGRCICSSSSRSVIEAEEEVVN